MADEPKGPGTSKALLLLAAAAVVIIVIWQLSRMGGGEDEGKTTYAVDATDESGGELIVTEPAPGAVEVDTPDTPMTNVPPTPSPTPAP